MKQGLSLGFAQSLTLTPQLQLSIRLLQLSSLELEQEIAQQLASNPFLERDDEASVAEQFAHADQSASQAKLDKAFSSSDASNESDIAASPNDIDELSWEGDGTTELAPNDSEWGVDAGGSAAQSQYQQGAEAALDPLGGLSLAEDLTKHLKRQALHLRLSPADAASLDFLIESLDERGFLVEPLEELASSLAQDPDDTEGVLEQFRIAKQWLQHLEPTGVGAANVVECLCLQAQAVSDEELRGVMLQLLRQPLASLARRDSKALGLAIGCAQALVQRALQRIAQLEPQPSRGFTQPYNCAIIPDVFVRPARNSKAGGFAVTLNTDVMPRLRVDDISLRLLKIHRARHTKNEAMQQQLVEARGFIKAMAQRFDTVLRVAIAIVQRQGSFLQHGAIAMRPLVLKEIADELGLHESTISRVTTNKYIATPQGTFEFKYFFDAGLATQSGGETSGTAVRALIAQMIRAEKKTKPLSDEKLADLLAKHGITCARRTVAKYREAMRIPAAGLRTLG